MCGGVVSGGVEGEARSAQAPLKALHRQSDLVAWSASLSFVSRESRDGGGKVVCWRTSAD